MKNNSWEDELLDDVLAEAATPVYRTDSLEQTLAAVQRRRAQRRLTRSLLVTCCVIGAIGFLARFIPMQKLAMFNGAEPLLVHSEPLSPGMFVLTQPASITTVNSPRTSLAQVEAIPAENLFEFIDDDRLLALLAGRPAALVYDSSAAAELVFVNPADANGFQ